MDKFFRSPRKISRVIGPVKFDIHFSIPSTRALSCTPRCLIHYSPKRNSWLKKSGRVAPRRIRAQRHAVSAGQRALDHSTNISRFSETIPSASLKISNKLQRSSLLFQHVRRWFQWVHLHREFLLKDCLGCQTDVVFSRTSLFVALSDGWRWVEVQNHIVMGLRTDHEFDRCVTVRGRWGSYFNHFRQNSPTVYPASSNVSDEPGILSIIRSMTLTMKMMIKRMSMQMSKTSTIRPRITRPITQRKP